MSAGEERVLVLTPVKNAASEAPGYFDRLLALDHPPELLSLGVLVSDSDDDSARVWSHHATRLTEAGWRRARVFEHDFGYRIPDGTPRWAAELQVARRTVLAKSRNHLLFRALDDEDWVLWIDADVIEFQPDIIRLLLLHRRDVLHPNCVTEWGGRAYDRNAWSAGGHQHLDDLRGSGWLVRLQAVGGTMLLVRADRHRDGLIFPPFPYGRANPWMRTDRALLGRDELGELETEGLGLMAHDMGITCWGLPHLEIRHRDVN